MQDQDDKTTLVLHADGVLHVQGCDERSEHFTAKEATLLLCMVRRKGSPLRKEHLMTELYQGRDEPEMKIVDVYVCKVRNKLRRLVGEDFQPIETVWGKGYRWRDGVEVLTPDQNCVTVDFDNDVCLRLEDLSLASGKPLAALIKELVDRSIDAFEKEIWE